MKGNWGGIGTTPYDVPSWAILSLDHMGRERRTCCIGRADSKSLEPICENYGPGVILYSRLMELRDECPNIFELFSSLVNTENGIIWYLSRRLAHYIPLLVTLVYGIVSEKRKKKCLT